MSLRDEHINGIVEKLFGKISFPTEPTELYDPLRYMISISGKRLRPRLCLTVYFLFNKEFGDEILYPAAALELFHSFTLMHDDIMDRSDVRRGKPTVWVKWDENTAILSGDVMLIEAFNYIHKAPGTALPEIMELFQLTTKQVCEGQQYDMLYENKCTISMEEYKQMIGLKTASLIACSAKMGALIAGAPKDVCDTLYNYGYQLGMAFQVADDYLDTFGDQKVFGKPIGGDILNGKKTWLAVHALEKSENKEAILSAYCIPAKDEKSKELKISKVKELYSDLGVEIDAKAEIRRYTDKAMAAVSDAGLSEDSLEVLDSFARNLVSRAR